MWQRGEFRSMTSGVLGDFDVREKAIATSSNGFYKARAFCGVTESFTDFVDRFIESVIKIHESVRGPELSLKFLAGYDLSGMLQKHRQYSEWLFLKANSKPVLAQFAAAKIKLENPKAKPYAKVKVFLHKEVNTQRK